MAEQEFSGSFIRSPAASQINHISYLCLIYKLMMKKYTKFFNSDDDDII